MSEENGKELQEWETPYPSKGIQNDRKQYEEARRKSQEGREKNNAELVKELAFNPKNDSPSEPSSDDVSDAPEPVDSGLTTGHRLLAEVRRAFIRYGDTEGQKLAEKWIWKLEFNSDNQDGELAHQYRPDLFEDIPEGSPELLEEASRRLPKVVKYVGYMGYGEDKVEEAKKDFKDYLRLPVSRPVEGRDGYEMITKE